MLEDEKNTAKNRAALIQQEYEKVKKDYESSKANRLNIGKLSGAE